MGDHADDLMFKELTPRPLDETTYVCGYCGKHYGTDKLACQKHSNNCDKSVQNAFKQK